MPTWIPICIDAAVPIKTSTQKIKKELVWNRERADGLGFIGG
ncbi:MAG: hypothetical protein U1A28_01905 [Patescibacteria group bacterium]|nr:hypothetical protein [Patescibacteria group bacterium]